MDVSTGVLVVVVASVDSDLAVFEDLDLDLDFLVDGGVSVYFVVMRALVENVSAY